jgi:hypothetical protein
MDTDGSGSKNGVRHISKYHMRSVPTENMERGTTRRGSARLDIARLLKYHIESRWCCSCHAALQRASWGQKKAIRLNGSCSGEFQEHPRAKSRLDAL